VDPFSGYRSHFVLPFSGYLHTPCAQTPPLHLHCHLYANFHCFTCNVTLHLSSPLRLKFHPYKIATSLHLVYHPYAEVPPLHLQCQSTVTLHRFSVPPMSNLQLNSTPSRNLQRQSYTETPSLLVGVSVNVRYRRNYFYGVHFNNILEYNQCYCRYCY